MNYTLAKQAIEKHFKDEWALTAYAAVPVSYENRNFTKPDNAPWIKLQIFNGESQQISLGTSPDQRQTGFVELAIKHPIDGTGTTYFNQLIDAASEIFRRALVSTSICFRTPTINGPFEIDGWFQYTASINFIWDEQY